MEFKSSKYLFFLIIISFLVYFNSIFNGFVWDDEEQIVNNSFVHSIVNIPTFFKNSTFNPAGAEKLPGLYYKPLMTSLFSIIYSLFGPHPFYFHSIQIILHIINSILVFLIFKHLLKKEKLSLFLSLIFLLHPINSETVLYISALQDILFFLFGSLALLIITKKTTIQYVLISSTLLLFSLLSKETAVLFVITVFLYLIFFKKN
ncbi:glycosyltransferase family 39 protein, partial [Candidatus Roizmanbacteria bacterium]|nr:glycosyltransferase family 39 protein [Candidatus Roizmanbacteria bacterium]